MSGLAGSQAVLVLGVHRSGTSALTKGLEALGVYLGENHLAPGEKENPKGFFEDKDILAFNERLLAVLGSGWDSMAPLPEGWEGRGEIQALLPEAEALLLRLFQGRARWGFKDPRCCVTLAFWQQAFRRLGAEARYVFALRHPMSVEQSLAARNGFATRKSHLLWLANILPAVERTRGEPRIFVDFDRLLAEPVAELSRIGAFLGVAQAECEGKVRDYAESFLSAELRHTVFTPASLAGEEAASDLERQAYDWLTRRAAGEEASEAAWTELHARWKQWRAPLEAAFLTDRLYEETRESLETAQAQLTQAQARIEDQAAGLAQKEAWLTRMQTEKEALLCAANRHDMLRLEDARAWDGELRGWLLGEGREAARELSRHMARFLSSRMFRLLARLKKLRDARRGSGNALPLATLLDGQYRQILRLLDAETAEAPSLSAAVRLLEHSLAMLFGHPAYRALSLLWRLSPARRSVLHPRILGALHRLHWTVRLMQSLPSAEARLEDGAANRRALLLPSRAPRSDTAKVDIVLPVYKGVEETIACIRSVLRSTPKTPYELVVVDDATPEPELAAALDKMAAEGAFTLLRNETNLGFIGAVNRGMSLHADRDVVLLNSDTEVYGDWLDRLLESLTYTPDVATATPLSNNAEICSYPYLCQDNPLPPDANAETLDALAAKANAGQVVDVPTGVGFCMAIRRKALDEVGLFDQERFGKGYGEENDFCMRAAKAGWRHVLAGDVFVYHQGGVSFSEAKRASIERAMQVLARLHPSYQSLVAGHIRRDAQLGLRRRLDVARLASAAPNRAVWLFVLHNFGGGTEKHAYDMAFYLKKEGIAVAFLKRPPGSDALVLERLDVAPTPNARFALHEFDTLVEALKSMDIRHVHYHHWIGLPEAVRDIPARLGVGYDVTLHDYYTICPRVNLNNETRRYCGEPPATECTACIRMNGSHDGHDIDVPGWREGYDAFLRGARRVFAPSRDDAERHRRYFPNLPIALRPHPEPGLALQGSFLPRRPQDPLRVAVIGAIGPHKGSQLLLSMAKDAAARGLPLSFHVIGYADNETALKRTGKVTLTGKYDDTEVYGLIAAQRCHLAFFGSVFPETYCYTLSMALAANLYPVSLELGAVPERLRALGFGEVVPYTMDAALLNDRLLAATPAPVSEALLARVQNHYASFEQDYYGFEKDAKQEAA